MLTPYQQPSVPELKKFGLIVGPLFALFFGWLIPSACQQSFLAKPFEWLFCKLFALGDGALFPYLFGGLLFVWALIHAKSLIIIHKPWMIVGGFIGFCISQVILLLLFLLLFMPMGFIMRILGRDPMNRKFDNALSSYREIRTTQDKQHMETPY